jgi:hypothetical protein
MGLPRLDVPVNLLTWEISLPERLQLKRFGGNALAAELFSATGHNFVVDGTYYGESDSGGFMSTGMDLGKLEPGQIGGTIVDPAGAVIPNASVTVLNKQTGSTLTTTSNAAGFWMFSGMLPGPVTVQIDFPGFKSMQYEVEILASHPARLGTTLEPGTVSETVQVTADGSEGWRRRTDDTRKDRISQLNAPSQNVLNLQRRVAGILPVRIDVPRIGKSYRFVRPLVLEEETKVTFQYKSK